MGHRNGCRGHFLPASVFQLSSSTKVPNVCQNNGRYQKVNVRLQSISDLSEAVEQTLRIRS
jgi:hypothetical protein